MKRGVGYLFMLMGTLGVLFSFPLFREGAQPCSGDGCIVQGLLWVGALLVALGGAFIAIGIWLAKPKPSQSRDAPMRQPPARPDGSTAG